MRYCNNATTVPQLWLPEGKRNPMIDLKTVFIDTAHSVSLEFGANAFYHPSSSRRRSLITRSAHKPKMADYWTAGWSGGIHSHLQSRAGKSACKARVAFLAVTIDFIRFSPQRVEHVSRKKPSFPEACRRMGEEKENSHSPKLTHSFWKLYWYFLISDPNFLKTQMAVRRRLSLWRWSLPDARNTAFGVQSIGPWIMMIQGCSVACSRTYK